MRIHSLKHALISRCSSRKTAPQILARSQDKNKRHSLASSALNDHIWTCKQGSVWFLSELDDCGHISACESDDADTLLLALDVSASVADFLEISARVPFIKHECEKLCATLARAWQTRPPGLAEMACRRNRKLESGEQHRAFPRDVLEPSNPAKLSRCEFRVCTMIKYGLTTKAIAQELSVHQSTIRSHLRSIYSKTGVNGQMELLHRLSDAETWQPSEAVVA